MFYILMHSGICIHSETICSHDPCECASVCVVTTENVVAAVYSRGTDIPS